MFPAGAALSETGPGLERFLELRDAHVAVCSSTAAEDPPRASFAGSHRPFLNVSGGAAPVEQAAQGGLDSLQTPEAIAYRCRMGFSGQEVQCALAIREMVGAIAAHEYGIPAVANVRGS